MFNTDIIKVQIIGKFGSGDWHCIRKERCRAPEYL